MSVHAAAVLVFGLVVAMHGQGRGGSSALLVNIRAGDTAAIQRLLTSGVDSNSHDASGTTALMYAAAFSSVATMRLLSNAGADVNATNQDGATALMWATGDALKVRFLLESGAGVNTARHDGATAVVCAALRGRTDVVGMLVAAGADVHTGKAFAPWALTLRQIALTTNDPAMRETLAPDEAGGRTVAEWTPPPLTRWLVTSIFSWRPQPASTNADLVKALLDAGADPNEVVNQLTLTVPALSRVARLGDIDAMRLMLDRGADPNRTGSGGLTPLMMAAATTADPAMVRLLLNHGAAVDGRDEAGNTALDWALTLGDTSASRVLRQAGAVQMARPVAIPPSVSVPRSVRPAIELALERLQPAAAAFSSRAKCISCHNHSLPSVAVKLADAKGLRIDRTLASHPTQATLAVWARSRENMMVGNCSVFGFLGNVTYGLFGLAEEGVAPSPETDAVASCLGGLQKPEGSWEGGDTRPPLAGRNPFVYTALAVRGLQVYSPPGRKEETTTRTLRALEFLRNTTADDTQAEAFKLLGLIWAGATRADISKETERLLRLQRRNGGWGQLPTMPPDAYATGQALYALRLAGTQASADRYRKGAAYLLRTQLPDGSWYVRSRAIGFQPYIDSGFPHGPDQFISAAATSWAVIALTHVS